MGTLQSMYSALESFFCGESGRDAALFCIALLIVIVLVHATVTAVNISIIFDDEEARRVKDRYERRFMIAAFIPALIVALRLAFCMFD